ncbi:MAG: hypothetical protein ABI790_16515 [Betaproteobacteria bacterium]
MTNPPRGAVVPYVFLMLAALLLWLATGLTPAAAAVPGGDGAEGGPAGALRAQHLVMRDQLASNPFRRPLVMTSSQTSDAVKGDIHAVVPFPFETVRQALGAPQGWCEILNLHLNTKYCKTRQDAQATALLMNVGKKVDQPLGDSYRLAFAWQLTDQTADYLRVLLTAADGPLSTRDYRIALEAVPLPDGTTFLHLSYAYGYGMTGKIAMLAYFNTVGRVKVGFTVTGRDADGQPAYIDGMRGLVERNTMRYYIAIDAFLGALAVPQNVRFEKRINDWFTASERYPRQLHEMEQADYLDMKRKEYRRQQLGETAQAQDLG